MEYANVAFKPLFPGLDLMIETKVASSLPDQTPYRQLVVTLMHLANTVRLDICYKVKYLARFIHKPTTALWISGIHFLRYIKVTSRLEIRYTYGEENKLLAYSDSSWAQKGPSKKLNNGNIFMMAEKPISSRS